MTKSSRLGILEVALTVSALLLGVVSGFLLGTTPISDNAPRSIFFVAVSAFLVASIHALLHPRFSHYSFVCPVRARFPILVLLATTVLATSLTSIPRKPRELNLWDRVGGFLPFSDAHGYYRQVLAAPNEDFDEFNSRRPLNAMIRILEFDLGGSSLLGIQIIQIALAAIAISVLGAAIANRTSLFTSFGVVVLASYWIWPYASSFLTEINGFTIAAASMGLLLFASLRSNLKLFLFGILGLVIAYLLRPYSPLLPAIFIVVMSFSLMWRSRKIWVITVVGSVAGSLALILLLPIFLSSLYSDSEASTPNGNTAVVLLGLTRGTDWLDADSYLRSVAPTASERELSRIALTQSVDNLLSDPTVAVQAFARNSLRSAPLLLNEFSGGYLKASCYSDSINFQALLCTSKNVKFWLIIPVLIASTWALLILLRRRDPIGLLFASSAVTYFTFAPIVLGDGGWRVAATLYPGLATLVALLPTALLVRNVNDRTDVNPLDFQTKSRPAGSTLPTTLTVGVIAFALLAIPYPFMRKTLKDPSTRTQSFVLRIGQDRPGTWTSANSGAATTETLIEWASVTGYPLLKSYLESSGSNVDIVTFDEDFRLWLKRGTDSEFPAQLEPLFQIESSPLPTQD